MVSKIQILCCAVALFATSGFSAASWADDAQDLKAQLEALENQDPLSINAYQYDIVCNGVELSSGAIRNHRPDIMYKAFEIVGYSKDDVDREFGHMINAFKYGAPPHGGMAPGVERTIMIWLEFGSGFLPRWT